MQTSYSATDNKYAPFVYDVDPSVDLQTTTSNLLYLTKCY